MKRHDDPFFNHFQDAFANHEVQAPAGTLAAVHRKMKKGGFWYFSWTSLNVYTLVALLSAGLAFTIIQQDDESAGKVHAQKKKDLSLVALEKTQMTLNRTQMDEVLVAESASEEINAKSSSARVQRSLAAGENTILPARAPRVNRANVERLKERHERILDKDLKHDYEAKLLEEAEQQAQNEEKVNAPVDNVLNAAEILKKAQSGAQETGIVLKSKTKSK